MLRNQKNRCKALRLGCGLLVAVLMIYLASFGKVEGTKQIELKVVLDGTTESTEYGALVMMKDMVEKNSSQRVRISIVPQCAPTGGNIRAAIDLLQSGGLDALVIPTGLYQSWAPEWGLLSLPFLAKDLDETYRLYNSPVMEKLLKTFEKNGLKGIDVWVRNGRQLLTVSKPVRSPRDLSGMRIRVPENPIFVSAFQMMGAIPVPTPWGEVYTALKLKTVDGMETPTSYIVSEKFYEVVRYVTFWDYSSEGMALTFNKRLWDTLPLDVQQIIEMAAKAAGKIKLEKDKEMTSLVVSKLRQVGVEPIFLTPEQHAEFVEKMAPVWSKFEGTIGKDLVDEARRVLGRTR